MRMMEKIKRGYGFIGVLIILVILLLVVSAAGYLLYMNIPGEPMALNPVVKESPKLEVENLSYAVKQFHPNMKFNHNSISYTIDSACSEEKKNRMIEAFNELSDKVGIISFYSVIENPDIEISCSEDEKTSVDEDYFIAGEGGAKEIIQTDRYNIITNGIILLYWNPHGAVNCDWSNIELHELLHVFGFEHSKDENSLMYPYLESCEQRLAQSIIDDLKELYSQPNLADLYFEKVVIIKKGRYLDFNVTIKNSGDIDAGDVLLGVFDEGERIGEADDFKLGDIKYGAGVSLSIQNIKLKNRNSKKIEIVLDEKNVIKEIDENNNVVIWEE